MKNPIKLMAIIAFIMSSPNTVYAYAKDYYIRFATEELPSNSKANMELVLSDFFNLFLTTEERDIVRTEVLKNIKITGYYKGTKEIRGVTYEVYSKTDKSIGTFILPSTTRYKREINLQIEAKIKDISIEENKVTFSLPVKTGKRNVFELYAIDISGNLEHLANKYPTTNLDFANIPRQHHITTGYMTHRHHFFIDVAPTTKTVTGQNYRVDKYYYPSIKRDNFPINGWIIQLNMLGDNKLDAAQVKAPLINSNKFSNDNIYFYYDTSRISSYDGDKANSHGLGLPSDDILPPIWQGLSSVFFDYNIHTSFDESYHKQEDNLVEVLVLKAEIPYVTHYGWRANATGKAEKWTKVRGKLTGISGGGLIEMMHTTTQQCAKTLNIK